MTKKKIARRRQPTAQEVQERRLAVEKALQKLKFAPSTERELRAALERPEKVAREEWKLGFAPDPARQITAGEYKELLEAKADIVAMSPELQFATSHKDARFFAEFHHAAVGNSPETWRLDSDCKKRKGRQIRRLTAKIEKRFLAPDMFRLGRPAYPYTALVIQYIDAIERATGKPFRFSRSTKTENKPLGPQFDLLHAALDRALFASGPPSRETIEELIRKRRPIPRRSAKPKRRD